MIPRCKYVLFAIVFVFAEFTFLTFFVTSVYAAGDVFRTTTYELQVSTFTGTTYTLTLNNDLEADYFTMISGSSDATGARSPDEDHVRITADPHSNFGSSTAANQLELTRADATNDWIGQVTVVECLIACATLGFQLSEVLETSLAAGTVGAQQTVTDTLAANHTSRTVPFGARFGGGLTTTGTANTAYAATGGMKISKVGANQIQFDRFGAEGETPAAATVTSYIVEWGSEWTVQVANVTGTNAGAGLDAAGEWDTATITSVNRDNAWVWGSGFTRDDGLGDGAYGQAITLGDGISQNTTETSVAVGGEAALITPGRDFEVYVMEHSTLDADYRFRARGDTGPGTGFQELDITVDAPIEVEAYDNASGTVQYTEGHRIPLFYNTSGGTGEAYSRTGGWGVRHDASTNLNYWRSYAGQPVTGWMQSIDFGDFKFSNVDTRQEEFRWRDDSVDLNTTGGWLAAEDTNPAAQAKNTDLRLRINASNFGTTSEDAARTYEVEFASKQGVAACSDIVAWTGVSDSATDAFELYETGNISPDGEATTAGLLSNGAGFAFVSGEGRENADTTSAIGPMSDSAYTELEYALRPTDDAITGATYCFRLFDTTANDKLDAYTVYPELTIESTNITSSGLGEAGIFTSAVDGGWTTINFIGNYTTPVVVGTTNSHNGQSALVFESRNVTATSAEMRICESEGSTTNGCDTHVAETVGYMVIDAAVAATTEGIEAGTFVTSGASDTTNVTTNYAETFTSTPLVFANVNTVTSTEFPIEVVVRNTALGNFNAGICDHLQGNNDACDAAHGNETVGWVAIEPGNEPFQEQNDSGSVSLASPNWGLQSFASAYVGNPVVIVSTQTDNGGQDVEIDEARNVSTTDVEIRSCEIDATDTCDGHAADTVAWMAIEPGEFMQTVQGDMDGFRFYDSDNSLTPTTALGVENTAIANVDNGDTVRLRMAIQSGIYDVEAGDFDVKLQYGQGTDCSAVVTWNDVGGLGSGTIWRGVNEAGPTTDGATLPSSLLDGGANTVQSYEEENPAVSNPNTITAGSRGEWDWAIENNGAAAFTSYCFRAITTADDVINYTRYPRLTTSTGVANQPPNDPANLDQERTSTTQISVGELINETTVVFQADVSDMNTSDILELCVEVDLLGTDFSNVEDACGTAVVYSGTTLQAELTLSTFANSSSYHWQARVRDAAGAYSNWVNFGSNPEDQADFSVDTKAPNAIVYDGSTAGVDIEFNGGELDELSGNWERVDGIQPTDISSLVLWLDGDDVNGTGTDPADGSPITLWTDKSGQANDIAGTGDATFSAAQQAAAFSDDVQPFDDNYDRSGGDANSETLFAVVTGNASTSNHVWFETTTPRVAPAENGILGGGTSLSTNNTWSEHIVDQQMFTLEYLSSGTSTAWLGGQLEYQFSETQSFANSQRLVIGDDTTGGNRLEAGEFVHEIVIYNDDLTTTQREDIWEYLQCKWNLKDCSVTYEYSIGTSPGGVDIVGWTSHGTNTSVTATGLSLETSQIYYINVRVTDAAGNQTVVSSDGQQVAPTLTFSTGSVGVTFENLNDTNNFTDTETTTLTTSTNARNGYTIRAYTTSLLTHVVSANTINMFDGGTYAAPDEWLTGDTGLGYTSSDPLVLGVNLFNPVTCLGGGSGPCYAPFTTSAPGDIVADNPGVISGTPITSEQFTITHRATVDPTEEIGTYQTTIIYNATAVY